jgi:hypothetical protein
MGNMKKILAGIILCLLVFKLDAQQTTQYNYHLFDDYLLNPAYVGTQNYYSVLLGRDQRFYGLKSGPQTYFLSVHSRVGQGYVFKKDGKVNEFFKKFGNAAFGLQFYQYALGPDMETNIGVTYGYHLDLAPNRLTKNPRKLILAVTPRLQGVWYNANNLYLISDILGSDDKTFHDSELGEYQSYRSWFYTTDVAALFQTIHVDAGAGALNVIQTHNKLDQKNYHVADSSYNTYDSLYPSKFFVNAKLKFLDVYTSDRFDVYFIPTISVLYYTKRNCTEYFVDLMMEGTFKKTIAGVRKEIEFVGQLGVNINHKREYSPTTLLQPYFTLDFRNYTITYAHSLYLENDLIKSGAGITGGNQISVLFKINRDRTIREGRYTNKFLNR